MYNTILETTKLVYDNNFVIVSLIDTPNDDEYAVCIQIDELTIAVYSESDNMGEAHDDYHDCLVNVLSMTFDEIMEETHASEEAEGFYEETLNVLGLPKDRFEYATTDENRRCSKIYDEMNNKACLVRLDLGAFRENMDDGIVDVSINM